MIQSPSKHMRFGGHLRSIPCPESRDHKKSVVKPRQKQKFHGMRDRGGNLLQEMAQIIISF